MKKIKTNSKYIVKVVSRSYGVKSIKHQIKKYDDSISFMWKLFSLKTEYYKNNHDVKWLHYFYIKTKQPIALDNVWKNSLENNNILEIEVKLI